MALINRFEQRPLTPQRLHAPVLCGYASAEVEGKTVLQLETYGSSDRKIPGKTSQSIQLDEIGAHELMRILVNAFPQLR